MWHDVQLDAAFLRLTSTLHKEFVVRLESEIDRVRLAYAEAMQKDSRRQIYSAGVLFNTHVR